MCVCVCVCVCKTYVYIYIYGILNMQKKYALKCIYT